MLTAPDPGPKLLAPVHPNAGITMAYRSRLDNLITRMHNSIKFWVLTQYNENPPIAQDSPASDLIAKLRGIGKKWTRAFNRAAEELAKWFAGSVLNRSDAALRTILKDAGWTVKFKATPGWNDVRVSTIQANVSLIKSIGSQHLTDVEQMVMESVQQGRAIGELTQRLEHRYGLTRKRAALIARDQNNKATAAITKVRHQELGITRAVWVHSAAGKEPRPKHVAFAAGQLGGPIYDIAKGAPIADNGGMTWPGVEINCRCITRPIIPGLEERSSGLRAA